MKRRKEVKLELIAEDVSTSPPSAASPPDTKFMKVEISPSTTEAVTAPKDEGVIDLDKSAIPEETDEADHGEPSGRAVSGGDATSSTGSQPVIPNDEEPDNMLRRMCEAGDRAGRGRANTAQQEDHHAAIRVTSGQGQADAEAVQKGLSSWRIFPHLRMGT